MSSEWKEMIFEDFLTLQRGHDLPDKERCEGNVPVLGSFGVTGYHNKSKAKGPGVTIGRSGASFGVASYTEFDYWPLNTALYVTDFKGNCPRFVYYFLKVFDFSGYNSGSAQPSLNRNNIYPTPITVPTVNEQERIAELLSALDDRIALLRETNATLESIAQAIFKSWFIDFDPVKAKQQGKEPQGMDAATAALFPDAFQDSELGPIPAGWKVKPFGELLAHTIGGDWGSDVPDQKNIIKVSIIRGTDFSSVCDGDLSKIPVRFTNQKKLISRQLQDGDIIIEVSGGSKDQPTGRSFLISNALLNQFETPVEPASFCRLLRPLNKDIGAILGQHLSFIYSQGKTWEYQIQSTGISNFQTKHFLEKELVVVPSENILSTFSGIIQPIIDRTHLKQIQQLRELRNTLLPRLISGRLRLPEAEAMAVEALG